MNDYTDYMVRTYISGSVDEARERTQDANEIALLDYTERYLLDMYDSGQMVKYSTYVNSVKNVHITANLRNNEYWLGSYASPGLLTPRIHWSINT